MKAEVSDITWDAAKLQQDPQLQRFSLDEIQAALDHLANNLDSNGDGSYTVRRALWLNDISQLRTEGVGIYWSYGEPSERYNDESYRIGSEVFYLEGTAPASSVDWPATVAAHIDYGYGEAELTLKKGAPIRLDSWTDTLKPYAHNPTRIFPFPPNTVAFGGVRVGTFGGFGRGWRR